MTAEQCLNHEWLRRKAQQPPSVTVAAPMEITKDNLKDFVERWNEHPNSPYVFEMTNYMVCRGGAELSDSIQSLSAMSPSPCGSVCSSPENDDAFGNLQDDNLLLPVNLDHIRRASDSTCVVKGHQDVTERINLADEIRKLSDKLFQLSTMSSADVESDDLRFKDFDLPTINEKPTPVIIKNNNLIKDPTNCVLPKDHPLNVNCGVPWRRPRNKINIMSRDVPLPHPKTNKNSIINQNQPNPNETKDLLLKLLEHWDGPQGAIRPNPRHSSFSSEFTENDALGQKTISSLNTFFQTRATLKHVSTPFHKN